MVKYTSPMKLICYLNVTGEEDTNNLEIAALMGLILTLWKSIAYP